MTIFRLGWAPVSSVVFEMFSPASGRATTYQTKFTPAFRTTLRPPVEERPLGRRDLAPVNDLMAAVFPSAVFAGRDASKGGPPPRFVAPDKVQELGLFLSSLVLPQQVETELRSPGLFLEIGIDEGLLEYPWELMHDGQEFYCLKHHVGRFVNLSRPVPAELALTSAVNYAPLRVLVICVDGPVDLGGNQFPRLNDAFPEYTAVVAALGKIPGVDVKGLRNGEASFSAVWKELYTRKYQIVHFIGHAHLEPGSPELSGLVLQDKLLTAGQLLAFMKKARPVLCFLNACESSSTQGDQGTVATFGLARAILESGAYLLGSRWKITDGPAGKFAPVFYESLLADGKPLGEAVTVARLACRKAAPDDLAWASYAYYGDPRVCFQKCTE